MLNLNRISPGKAKETLKILYKLKSPGFLWGSHGIGKSSIVHQMSDELGINLIDLRLSQLSPEDLRGLPYLHPESHTTIYYSPDFLPKEGEGILFLDELNRAAPDVQNAALQLILDRKLGDYHLPDGWMCIGAGNESGSDAGVFDMTPPLADRMTHFHVVVNVDEWLSYAITNKFHPSVITFIKMSPAHLNSIGDAPSDQSNTKDKMITPSPRSWEEVSKFLYQGADDSQLTYLIEGRIGVETYLDFKVTLENIKELPDIPELFTCSESVIANRLSGVSSKPSLYGLIYSLQSYADDMPRYRRAMKIITTLLSNRTSGGGRMEYCELGLELLLKKVTGVKNDRWEELAKFEKTSEYQEYAALRDSIGSNP